MERSFIKYYYLGALLFLSGAMLNAQSPYFWHLTTEEGLPSAVIYYLEEDSRGYIWAATSKGLARYNGQEFEYFSHPQQKGESVTEIREDWEGNVWYRNFSGQLFYVDVQDSIHLLPLDSSVTFQLNFQYYFVGHKIIINSIQGFCIYDRIQEDYSIIPYSKRGKKHELLLPLQLIPLNNKKIIYISETSSEGNVSQLDVGLEKTSLIGTSSLVIKYMSTLPDTDSCLFFNNTHPGHAAYITSLKDIADTASYIKIPTLRNYKNEPVASRYMKCYVDDLGILWIGTTKGVFGLEKNNGTWRQKYYLLPNEQISSILRDKEGNLWLGTLGGGIAVFPNIDIHCYNSKNSSLQTTAVFCMTKDKYDNLLLGDKNGTVSVFNPSKKQVLHKYTGQNSPVTTILYHPAHDLVLFNAYCLSVFEYNNPTNDLLKSFPTLSGNQILSAFHQLGAFNNNLIVALRKNGLSYINLFGKEINFADFPPIRDERAHPYHKYTLSYIVGVPKGHLIAFEHQKRNNHLWWLATTEGLFYVDKGQYRSIKMPKGVFVRDLKEDGKGGVWATTTRHGLFYIEGNQVKKHYNSEGIMPTNNFNEMALDGQYIWIGTNLGLMKFDTQKLTYEIFNHLDGVPHSDIQALEIIGDRLWLGGSNGLVSIERRSSGKNLIKPKIEITNFYINNKKIAFGTAEELNYNQNNIRFEFQTTAIKGRKDISYEYRILGLDTLWTTIPYNLKFAQFQGLSPASYQFQVRAVNEDGISSENPVSFKFIIHAPYWEHLWFQLLGYLILFLIIAAIVYWRYSVHKQKQARLLKNNQLRMQALQSQMNPHFIFNAMSTIQEYWMRTEQQYALKYHAKFASLMRLIFSYSTEKFITIEEEVEFLKLYTDLECMRFEHQISVDFCIDNELIDAEMKITPLLIQPIVENCFKHGLLHKEGNGLIQIEIRDQQTYIRCSVYDDGIGRKEAAKLGRWKDNTTKTSSQTVIEERLFILNKSYGTDMKKSCYKITDLEQGTRVEIWIPKIE